MSEQRPDRPGRKNNQRPPAGGANGMKFGRGLFGWVLFIGLAVMLFVLLQGNRAAQGEIEYSEFESRLDQDKVAWIRFTGDKIEGEFTEPQVIGQGEDVKKFFTELPAGSVSSGPMVTRILDKRGNAKVGFENNQNLLLTILVPLIPWLLIFGFIWFFVFRMLRAQQQQRREPTPVVVVNRGPG